MGTRREIRLAVHLPEAAHDSQVGKVLLILRIGCPDETIIGIITGKISEVVDHLLGREAHSENGEARKLIVAFIGENRKCSRRLSWR